MWKRSLCFCKNRINFAKDYVAVHGCYSMMICYVQHVNLKKYKIWRLLIIQKVTLRLCERTPFFSIGWVNDFSVTTSTTHGSYLRQFERHLYGWSTVVTSQLFVKNYLLLNVWFNFILLWLRGTNIYLLNISKKSFFEKVENISELEKEY